MRDQDKAFDLLSAARSGKEQRERCLALTYEKISYFETVFGGMTIGRYINGLIGRVIKLFFMFIYKNRESRVKYIF